MTEQALSLATVFAGWTNFQSDLMKAIIPLTPEQWALPLAANQWTISRQVQHLAADRLWWFGEWMGECEPTVASLSRLAGNDAELCSPAEIVSLVETSGDVIARTLATRTSVDLTQVFDLPATATAEDRERFGPTTRQWIMFHVLRHDLHHGGELALAMGTYGLDTIWGGM